ncbi:energy transducer TonB [Kaistella palustris]|uniref:energy transducer TonB n=1 Tax=Kaistella palustris TaxID=493376 RepID=UPI001C63EC01|nr:energy transducer TonB [Kaistella palustris]
MTDIKSFCAFKRPLGFLLMMISMAVNGQILNSFPRYQVPYLGGYEGYYSDFHRIINEQNLKPCSDPDEFYQFSVLINPDGSINFIKDHNVKNVSQNQCAHDLAREVARHQQNWNAATVDGFKQPAVAMFLIYPADLFGNYREGYTPDVKFPGYGKFKNNGIQEFRQAIANRTDLRGFSWDDRFDVIVDFVITKNSQIRDVIFIKSSGSDEFDKRIANGIKSTAKRWTPATINGKSVDFTHRITLNAVTD